jgi:hypothetical protein
MVRRPDALRQPFQTWFRDESGSVWSLPEKEPSKEPSWLAGISVDGGSGNDFLDPAGEADLWVFVSSDGAGHDLPAHDGLVRKSVRDHAWSTPDLVDTLPIKEWVTWEEGRSGGGGQPEVHRSVQG